MNCAAQLKTTDSTTVSTPALKRILAAAEQKKILDGQVIILNQRISGLQLTINDLQERDTATVGSYERQILTMKDQRTLMEAQVKTFEKMVRKERIKRKVTGFAGILTTGIALYFATKN